MTHSIQALIPEYSALLTAMVVRPECERLVDEVAHRLLPFVAEHYAPVTAAIGVPPVFIGPSFEREGSSNFNLNPAQGWPLNSTSRIIPHNGPFRTWFAAAIAAYKIDGLDRVGAGNWTWETVCYYGEALNGWGYRDEHHMHTPYLWAGTNIQTPGKYVADGKFEPVMDEQLGMMPVALRMAQLEPSLNLPRASNVIPPPQPSMVTPEEKFDARWVQSAINALGYTPPLDEDGNYGKDTKRAVEQFQQGYGLVVDGIAGAKTIAALGEALRAAGK